MTREEHMEWAKARALAYLPDDPRQAITSMISDLDKHPETKGSKATEVLLMTMLHGSLDAEKVRKFIESFN